MLFLPVGTCRTAFSNHQLLYPAFEPTALASLSHAASAFHTV